MYEPHRCVDAGKGKAACFLELDTDQQIHLGADCPILYELGASGHQLPISTGLFHVARKEKQSLIRASGRRAAHRWYSNCRGGTLDGSVFRRESSLCADDKGGAQVVIRFDDDETGRLQTQAGLDLHKRLYDMFLDVHMKAKGTMPGLQPKREPDGSMKAPFPEFSCPVALGGRKTTESSGPETSAGPADVF